MECITLPLHTTVHIAPSYHISTSRSTLFHFAIPYFKPHHIGHNVHHATDISHCTPFHITDVPHDATFHVLDATLYIGHFNYAHHHISHHTTFYTRHCTALACSTSCIILPHLTVITPNSTSHCRVSHNIPHHTSVHHHILHPTTYGISHNTTTTSRITPYLIPHRTTLFHITFHITHQYTTTFYIPPLITSRITPLPRHVSHRVTAHTLPHSTSHNSHIPCHSPHSTSLHIAQRSTFHATEHVPVHITRPLSITPFQFERLGTICDPFCYVLSFTYNLLYHISNPTQKW